MLLLQASLDLGAMAVKEYSAFPKAPALLETQHDCLMSYLGHSLVGRCCQYILQEAGWGIK